MFEQQSAFVVHGSLSTPQMAPPHTPPLQFRSQQSSARVHLAPLPEQKPAQRVTPDKPVTGSQRLLQH